MGSAESAKSCFLVFYDTNQTPYAAICCEVDPDNGGQSGGFEAAFTNPDLTEGATLERITEENHEPDRRRIRRERRKRRES